MGKRMVCLLFVLVLMVVSVCGVRASALPASAGTVAAAAKTKLNHKANPLPSAMFLVLAGVSVSMLFDKKK